MRRRLVGLLITLVCAAAGGAVAWWLAAPTVTPDPPLAERARAAAAVLADTHVYVDPSVEDLFTEQELGRLDAAAAASDPQVFLVVWPNSRQAGYDSPADVLHQIGALTDRPGLYIEVSPDDDVYSTDVGITAEYFSVYGALDGAWTSAAETARLLEEIAENDGREYTLGEDTGSDYWGGAGETIAAGLVIGGFSGIGAGLLGLVGWALARRRKAAA
ncbi:hypothetical protein E1262_08580 [Jiangella aurantiaca]|uniref:TPM domain-containing protein n=1 Tax=Jiangella aurantiaca TaxID=2530373 RepID=A0A4R5AH16_9ACTN|nr:hypothetical protein [Jiangella aurantiaca]TDD70696.1 hypothetical protein E1262_08580 [Jiangella aurantiaca]